MILNAKQLIEHKQNLFVTQNGVCALTGIQLNNFSSSHLDHDHILDGQEAGRCRGLLLPNANVLEGRIKHQFIKSGLKDKIDYLDFLKRLVVYLETDYTNNPIHPKLIPDLVKRFSRLSLQQMKQQLTELSLDSDGSKKELVKKYRTYLRQNYGISKKN
ncbi:endonuclease domain-containing protein [Pantoea stewartii]|uniref:endonuclease domain-containing protein n=1 Tax=Pantoea stewartii TaxID=66269 RepID=UPI001980DE80|nr:endonuclease domain-containing protein [Pantoea stewartii]